ncbi:hypothetical protein TSUD_325380 [Trifolium subterraneum]|uniref:Uncharacterized protein n=1 Tax=Trifolium subterraneum TaxID=3900 RepID=A0A2Z6M8I2_TRISU|nr:hypothetical protein TSUD_325380 [Trifolium subterraneum]
MGGSDSTSGRNVLHGICSPEVRYPIFATPLQLPSLQLGSRCDEKDKAVDLERQSLYEKQ